jgi:hypothetical protein
MPEPPDATSPALPSGAVFPRRAIAALLRGKQDARFRAAAVVPFRVGVAAGPSQRYALRRPFDPDGARKTHVADAREETP